MTTNKSHKWIATAFNWFLTLMLLVSTITTQLTAWAQEANDSTITTEVVTETPEVGVETVSDEGTETTESTEDTTSLESEESSSEESSSEEEIMASSVNGPAKDLPNAIKKLTFYDAANNAMSGDPIKHVQNAEYGMELNFDLTPYDNNLNNGDSFTFTVPAPMTLIPKTVELNDDKTKVNIATAVVESAGAGQGGTIKITLKNLEEYLRVKGGNNVVAVKGYVKVNYKYEELGTHTLPITDATTTQTFNHQVVERTAIVIGAEGEHLYKGGGVIVEQPWSSATLGKDGDAYHPWALYINRPQIDAGTLVVHDYMSLKGSPWQFIPESFKLYRVEFAEGSRTYKRLELIDHSSMIVFANNYTDMTLTIPNSGTTPYVLEYNTTAPGDGTYIWNEATITNDGQTLTIHKNGETLETKRAFSKLSAGVTIDVTFRIVLFKVDADDPTLRLPGAKFRITSTAGYDKEFISDASGMVYADKDQLVAGEYTVTELEAPPGYIRTMEPFTVKVGKDGVVKTVTNKREEITFTATKKWIGAPANRPEISLQLKRDGVAYGAPKTIEANSQDGATAVWKNLPKYQRGTTTPSVYTVEEAAVANYTVAYKDLTATSVTVENTNTEKVEVTVTKVWEDKNNKLQARPANITLKLLDGTTEVQTAEVTGDATVAQWTHTFTNLPKYRVDGTEIAYTVDEVLPANSKYTKNVQGTTVTNTINFDEKITVSGKKVWNDNNDAFKKRPDSIKVNLLQNNNVLKSETVTGAGNEWTFQFTELPKFDANGDVYTYTVTEEFTTKNSVGATDVYTSTITGDVTTGFTITNEYVNQETVSVSGKKVWEDANNQDGVRPQSISVTLYINGSPHQASTVELSEANGWAYSFTDLPKYSQDAKEHVYTVRETAVPQGYSVEYKQTATGNDIINKYTPGKTSVSVTKVWEDADDQDGVRSTEVQVQLLADGVEQGAPVTLNEGNKWLHTWADLDQKKAGKDIAYSVKELAVDGYTTAITGDATTSFTVTNTHVPATVSVKVNKQWDDAMNQDGLRPAEIKVQLLADGAEQGEPVTLNEANKWMHTFADLAQKKAGKDIAYSVKELTVDGYTTAVTGDAATGFTITNTHTPSVVTVSGTKVWNDADNQQGLRPASIKVNVLADGKVVTSKEVTEADNWAFEVTNLPEFAAGKKIAYTVTEDSVANYTTTYAGEATTGVTITNTYNPQMTNLMVVKEWNDANDVDKLRPASIEVELLVNNQPSGMKAVLNAENNWSHNFEGLNKVLGGKEQTYSVKEVVVPEGYTSEVKVVDEKNVVITNTHTPKPAPKQEKKVEKALPKTGESMTVWTTILGAVLLVGAAGGVFYSKKQQG